MTLSDESPVYAYLKNASMVDFPGHLSAVLLVSGCNFRCGYCHNAELMRDRQKGISWSRLEETCRAFRNDWVDAATIFGGEPTILPELKGLLEWLKGQGWQVKVDTNGSMPDRLAECLPLIDYVAMDVKTALSGYPALTGFSNTEKILASMDLIRKEARDYEFRTTVIETVHDDDVMQEIAGLVKGARRYVLQPYVPREHVPDPVLRALPKTANERLEELRDLMQGCADEVLVRGE